MMYLTQTNKLMVCIPDNERVQLKQELEIWRAGLFVQPTIWPLKDLAKSLLIRSQVSE